MDEHGVGHSPQTRSLRSGDSICSCSASEHIIGACVAPSVSKAHRASPSRPLCGLASKLLLTQKTKLPRFTTVCSRNTRHHTQLI